LTGEVVAVDTTHKMMTVRHNEVQGYMPAMTMEFAVSAGDALAAHAGEKIRAQLVVGKDDALRLTRHDRGRGAGPARGHA
jgi:protein SCO1/2